ncbi:MULTISPECIES: hypothetical protein [unclassified Streptomyces]|uniref:hypothetical protein n=1 Tax=unclassified Streptomyces TaxID=2593676 RepID=UPI000F4546FA|nr:hypothetical protein [Streptomyces sp. I6]RNL73612.1 hypothetical protein EBF04_27285 [Streptomyces sp. I6]
MFDLGDVDDAEETHAGLLVDRRRTRGLRQPDTITTQETLPAVRRRRTRGAYSVAIKGPLV